MPDGNFLSTMSQLTFGIEHPVEQELTGGTVTTNTVTGLTSLTVNKYRGQTATVKPRNTGAVNGKVYHITSNTATVITFEEDVATDGLVAADCLIITQVNYIPTDLANYFGHVEEADLPVGKYSGVTVFPHGGTNKPARDKYVQSSVVYEADIPIKLVTGKILALAMGKCIDDARNIQSYTLGAKTLSQDTVIGQKTVYATAHGFTSGYIQIGDPAQAADEPEVRVIDTVTTDTITFTEPLRNEHDATEELTNFASIGTGYMKHTLKHAVRLPSWALKRTLFRHKGGYISNTDDCTIWTGIKIKALKLSHSMGDELVEASISIAALNEDVTTEKNRESVSDISDYSATPYYRNNSLVTINSIEYPQAGDFNGGIEREMATKSYSNSWTGIKPWEHIEGTLTSDFSVTIPFHTRNLYNLMKNGTKFDVSYKFSRDGSTTGHDNIDFQFKDCYMESAPESLPKDAGEIDVEHSVSPAYLQIVIEDSEPYY